MSGYNFITISPDEHNRIKNSDKESLVVEKKMFENKNIMIWDKNEIVAKINIDGESIKIKTDKLIVNVKEITN